MKKEIVVLLLIFCTFSVLAMNDAITVKAPNGHVKLYAWTAGGGPLLMMNEGDIIDGVFSTTFYSLNVPTVKFQAIIIEGDEKIAEGKFDNTKISEPLLIDCSSENCTISEYKEEIKNETIEPIVINETKVDNNSTIIVKNNSKFLIIGKSIFVNEDGTIKYEIIGGIFACIILIILVIIFARKKKKTVTEDTPKGKNLEDQEFEEIEEKIKKNEQEIKTIKESEFRRIQIEEARKKLQEEENEIKSLREKNNSGQNQTTFNRNSAGKPNPYAGNSNLKDRTDAQNNRHIKSFVDNMRKFANDRNNQSNT